MAQRALLIFRIEQIVRRGDDKHAQILPPERARAVMAFETNRENNGPLQ